VSEQASFHVDLVADGIRMTGTPDRVPPLTDLDIPGLAYTRYRAYPIVDHVADKTCAILERHGPDRRPSTRFKDLVDLVGLTSAGGLTAAMQRHALVSEAGRRGIQLPPRFAVPDVAAWERGYSAEARRAILPTAPTLRAALDSVCPYLDPLLDGSATGGWHPAERRWIA